MARAPAAAVTPNSRKRGPVAWSNATRWATASILLAGSLVFIVWLVFTDAPIIRFTVRLYQDKYFLRDTVAAWGWAAPLVFMAIQALQVIISPIPGEITGPVGGALFGTLFCFWVGRKWGEPLIRPWLSEHHWEKMNFILEAEGAIICFILYVIPGFPKDIISYLFGISPMPFWLFAVVSTVGRIPGTWISSYFGAHVGEQQYFYAAAFIALVTGACLPLYYHRERIIARFRRKPRVPRSDGKERAR